MKKNSQLEHVLERNRVLLSSDPIEAVAAQLHLHSLVHEVETTGRFYDLLSNGRLAGTLQPETSAADA